MTRKTQFDKMRSNRDRMGGHATKGGRHMPSQLPIPPREVVYQCIVELHATGRIPTREVIQKETGLKITLVDEQFKRLREEGRIEKVVNGVYEPVKTWGNQVISCTMLDDGRAALEIGDVKLIITPTDGRNIIKVVGGFALAFGR